MEHRFRYISPVLKLDDELQSIKDAVLRERSATRELLVDEALFAAFASRLDGHWGSLYKQLPLFFQELLHGNWEGDADQRVPSSLLGDFGEFVGAAIVQRKENAPTEVARVIRASALARPDFIMLNGKTSKVTAIECKA